VVWHCILAKRNKKEEEGGGREKKKIPQTRMSAVDVYVVDVQYDGEMVGGVWSAFVQIFGRRSTGESVYIRVNNFSAYFYCLAPSHPDQNAVAQAFAVNARGELKSMADGMKLQGGYRKRRGEQLMAITIGAQSVLRFPTVGYQKDRSSMVQVVCSHPMAVAPLRDTLVDRGIAIEVGGRPIAMPKHAFEANLEYVLRFMVDTGVRCGAWVAVTPTKTEYGKSVCTSADIVCDHPSQLRPFTDDDEKQRGLVPALTFMSFDIECAAEKGMFPKPKVDGDAVIQIACDVVRADGRPIAEIEATAEGVLFCLHSTDKASVGEGVDVRCFEHEARMLIAFARFVREECDPDVLTSWNGPNFDWKYITKRVDYLGCGAAGLQFSRLPRYQTRYRKPRERATKAHGTTKDNEVVIPGRVVFDMLVPVKKNNKLPSYKLDAVAEHFLDERKDDVKHTEITSLWRSGPQGRGKLGHYCWQDARLPRRLLFKTQLWTQYVEIGRVVRTPLTFLVSKGEGIKVFTQLCHKARSRGFAVDYIPHDEGGRGGGDAVDALRKEAEYEGATVLEPKRGFYRTPVATLDFTALYPSIMTAHNLCYTTHVPKDKVGEYDEGDLEISPSGDAFVRPHVRKGLLPTILTELSEARGRAKALLAQAKEAGDSTNAPVYDKRQLALKISANSVYGFTGAVSGKLPLQAIARSVTAYGRAMIDLTKETVERVGPPGTEVIYGDTDSVMILYPCSVPSAPDGKLTDVAAAVGESIGYAHVGAAEVNKLFPPPVNLAFEKVFYPYLLISKKRYAGGYFEEPADERMFVKAMGIESQRRDNCPMLRRTIDEVLTCLMDDFSPERAISTAQDVVRAVVRGAVTPEDVVAKCAAAVGACDGALEAEMTIDLENSYREGFAKGDTVHALKGEWCAIASRLAGLHGASPQDAVRAVEDTLRQNVTLDDHVISKAFSRPANKYADIQPHIEVLKRMAKRDHAADEIAAGYKKYLGDRIDYIVIAPCATRPDQTEEYVEVKDTSPEKLKGCFPIGYRDVETARAGGEVVVTRQTIMGKKKKVRRVADRTEDPEWASANGHGADATYYIERQLINPVGRLLKALVGTKETAIRRILEPVKRTTNSKTGFYPHRFSADTRGIISGMGKRAPSPAVQDIAAQRAWDQKHGTGPSAPKRPRVETTGPMDAFLRKTEVS
jgi:DNA polymerase delta subunit 1